MQNVSIKSFMARDNAPLAATHTDIITRLCRGVEGDGLNRQDIRDWIDNDVICHVAIDNVTGQVRGGLAIVLEGNNAEFIGVVVDFDSREMGVGGLLLASGVEDCRARGIHKIALDIRLTNAGLHKAAYRLYYGQGFRLITGVKITRIYWNFRSRHLWRNADPGGVFRSRIMELPLVAAPIAAKVSPKIPEFGHAQ